MNMILKRGLTDSRSCQVLVWDWWDFNWAWHVRLCVFHLDDLNMQILGPQDPPVSESGWPPQVLCLVCMQCHHIIRIPAMAVLLFRIAWDTDFLYLERLDAELATAQHRLVRRAGDGRCHHSLAIIHGVALSEMCLTTRAIHGHMP